MHLISSISIFGIGLDVYLIIIILWIPIFFIWQWLFKKPIVSKRKRVVATWLVTMFSTPLAYVIIILIWFLAGIYYPNHNFNKADWINNKGERYELSDDIINSKMLIGKTKVNVEKLLGDEGNKEDSDDWFYDLGFTPGSIDPDSMEIEFKSGNVENVVRHKHH
jgi:hypothetical protein